MYDRDGNITHLGGVYRRAIELLVGEINDDFNALFQSYLYPSPFGIFDHGQCFISGFRLFNAKQL
ncbi:hypothetical protein [Desulfosporosinus sp. OT]|uniref:hypothetical protein n=1 Tax=Desulfosporosinus sp. OT TaxID=913865 RepID=UPI001300BF81|nr:hypothetical protein [Desulfosporosinus sp. OT]